MLYGGLSESNQKEVKLDVPIDAFKFILRYIYTGKINLRLALTPQMDLILDTLGLSNLFCYTELKDEISSFLKNAICLSNVLYILDASRLHDLHSLTDICYTYIDKNAEALLAHESFKVLYKDTLICILNRDSFFIPEIKIFEAIKNWIEANHGLKTEEILEVVSKVRLPLITLEDLLTIVRPTKILDPDTLLDAIHAKTKTKVKRLQHRGKMCPEENIAVSKNGALVIQGTCDGFTLIEEQSHAYDMEKGFARHSISSIQDANGIIIQLGNVYIINHIKILLWDLDNRSYSYVIDVSVDRECWDRVVDHSSYYCRSWQFLYFEQQPVKFIRITGTHNTVNKVFHLVSVEAMFTSNNVPKIIDGLVYPKVNVATQNYSAIVLEGVSRNKNSLLNGNFKDYDWDNGYTCHQLGSGNILIQLGQPYLISSFRILLWDYDERTYSFYIETSVNETDWELIVNKKNERLQSWQAFSFDPRPITFIRITGTYNSANEIFHIVHFECPNQA